MGAHLRNQFAQTLAVTGKLAARGRGGFALHHRGSATLAQIQPAFRGQLPVRFGNRVEVYRQIGG